jgi:hypothetical protein
MNYDLHTAYSLTAEQVRFYRENGFIKLKQVLAPATLAHYGGEVSRLVDELNTQRLPLEQRNTYQKAFLQIVNLWTKSAVVKEFVLGQRLGRLAAELMGCRGVRLYHDQALWHADQYYWPFDTPNTCTVWIPLQATPLAMGPLAFSAGSHRYQKGRELGISDESENQISKALLEQQLPMNETPFDLGEVSFHAGWTFHRAGANTTTEPRRVMTIIYHDADAVVGSPTNKAKAADMVSWLPGCKPGDVAASPLNPLIYCHA